MVNPADPPSAGDRIAPIAIDVRRFPWIRRLAADYAFDFRSVAPFFSGDPSDRQSWSDVIARRQAQAGRREEIASIIAAQQERRGAPRQSKEAAKRLADAATVAIVTGQQAGLFGGPLFTLLKALTAVKLAEKVSAEHGVTAVPIFWIEAEDHDWEEVRSCTVLDESLTPQAIALPPDSAPDLSPVATIRLQNSIREAIDDLAGKLPETEFREALLTGLRECYAVGRGMADAFGRWMEHVLGDRGLVVYDSSDPASKPLAAAVFTREILVPGETGRRAGAAGSELAARGYHVQVHAGDDGLALFSLDGGRRIIRQQNGQFFVGDKSYQKAALAEQASTHPDSFSPNVLLRPIVQDTLFPTICYVAGPNELAYLGQLRGVYEHFGVPMPLMYPRASATLLDSAAVRFLRKYDLPLEALQTQDDSGLNALLASQIPPAIEDSFAGVVQSLESSMTRLVDALPALDPTLQGAAKSTLGRMQHDLGTLHNKVIQAAKRRDETLRRQYSRTRALAFPNGHAQEREVGFVSFLNQYGPALIDRLHDELPLDIGRHWIVSI